jgi:hypothetical protein
MLPIDLDIKKKYYDIIYHVWEAISVKSTVSIERANTLIKNEVYSVNA